MTSLNIMVVDDSKITQRKLSMLLEQLGHTIVHVANTGKEAVAAYEKINPDLVTMDITMPDMDGIEATKKIIEIYPDALIMMVTSHGQEQMVMDAIRSGALGYVIKPFKKEKLEEQIKRIVEKFI